MTQSLSEVFLAASKDGVMEKQEKTLVRQVLQILHIRLGKGGTISEN